MVKDCRSLRKEIKNERKIGLINEKKVNKIRREEKEGKRDGGMERKKIGKVGRLKILNIFISKESEEGRLDIVIEVDYDSNGFKEKLKMIFSIKI